MSWLSAEYLKPNGKGAGVPGAPVEQIHVYIGAFNCMRIAYTCVYFLQQIYIAMK